MSKGAVYNSAFSFGGTNGTLKMLRNDGLKPPYINGKLSIKVPELVIPKQIDGFSSGTFRFDKNMMTKKMTVSYKPGTGYLGNKPMPYIRISNKYLQKYGFEHGDKIIVKYQRGKITITKHEQHNRA